MFDSPLNEDDKFEGKELPKELFSDEVVEFVELKLGRDWDDIPVKEKVSFLESISNDLNARKQSKLDY